MTPRGWNDQDTSTPQLYRVYDKNDVTIMTVLGITESGARQSAIWKIENTSPPDDLVQGWLSKGVEFPICMNNLNIIRDDSEVTK